MVCRLTCAQVFNIFLEILVNMGVSYSECVIYAIVVYCRIFWEKKVF